MADRLSGWADYFRGLVYRATAIELGEDDLRDIETAASHIKVQGHRYSEAAQRMINR